MPYDYAPSSIKTQLYLYDNIARFELILILLRLHSEMKEKGWYLTTNCLKSVGALCFNVVAEWPKLHVVGRYQAEHCRTF